MGFDAPAMFPSNGVMTWRPLLSTGSLGMVPPLPRYYGTLRLPAVHLDPFVDDVGSPLGLRLVVTPVARTLTSGPPVVKDAARLGELVLLGQGQDGDRARASRPR